MLSEEQLTQCLTRRTLFPDMRPCETQRQKTEMDAAVFARKHWLSLTTGCCFLKGKIFPFTELKFSINQTFEIKPYFLKMDISTSETFLRDVRFCVLWNESFL